MKKRICLGRIMGAHGVKGLIKVLPYGDDPKLIETLGPVFTDESGDKTLTITMKNSAGKHWLASVEGVTERDGAQALRATELWVDRKDLPQIENDGTYYHADLVGLKALDDTGAEIGQIIAVHNFGAGDLLEIRPLSGDTYYLPFKKNFVRNIDIKNGTFLADTRGLNE